MIQTLHHANGNKVKGVGNFVPDHFMNVYEKMEVWLHLLLTSTINGCEWVALCSGRLRREGAPLTF